MTKLQLIFTALRIAARVFHIARRGEPVFVLRAQDQIAEKCVRDWAARLMNVINRPALPNVTAQKIGGALQIADAMKAWPTKKLPD